MTFLLLGLLWLVLPLPVLVVVGRAMALGLCDERRALATLPRQSTSEA